MKKIISLVLTLVLLLVVASAASAEQPPGVAPAVKIDPAGGCGLYGIDENGQEGVAYIGYYKLIFSNGATGHVTFKCKTELQPGYIPLYDYIEWSDDSCHNSISYEGNKATWTEQCVGLWAGP
jgi:opacity protein-like surface antigen